VTIPCGCCSIGQGCRLVPSPTPAFSGRLTNVAGNRTAGPGPNTFTFTNFAGSGITVTVSTVGDTLAVSAGPEEPDTLGIGVSPPADVTVNVAFSQPVYLRSLGMSDIDDNTEDAYNFQPQIGGVYGQKLFRPGPGCHVVSNFAAQNPQGMVHDTVNNGTGGMTWPGTLTSSLTFSYGRCAAGLGAFLTELAFDLASPVYEAVFSCRMPDGDIRWYTAGGALVPDSEIAPCPAAGPISGGLVAVTDLQMVGAAFNDAANEFICNVIPAPVGTTGWAPPAGGCYDPTVAAPTMNWTGSPVSSVEMEYGSPAGVSGGVLVEFRRGANAIPFPVNLTPMAVGEARVSNTIPVVGGYAVLTYVSGPATGNAPRMEGPSFGLTSPIGLHRISTNIVAPIRIRLDLYA